MKKKTFIQRFRFKYRVSILNENTLEEAWHARMSRMSVFVWVGVFLFITFSSLAFLILFTPLKQYLPGYGDNTSVRLELMEESFRIDSIMTQATLQSEYVTIIQSIISGDITTDSIALDSASIQRHALILSEKSKIEQEFCENYEEEARYSLPLLANKQDAKAYTFFKPVRGIVSSNFSSVEKQYGISITTEKNENVTSVLDGTVVFAALTLNNDWVITIQHKDNYVSSYKNNMKLLKAEGDQVKAGETIAIVESTESSERDFLFEIWKEGVPIDPQDVIAL